MAIISLKLKVIANEELKQDIKNAHITFNEIVRLFEDFLLLAQGKDYYYTDDGTEIYKPADVVITELKNYLSDRGIKDVDKCVEVLKNLRNVISDKKSQAAGMLTKLYDKDSSAGTNNIKKIIDPLPEWVEHYDVSSGEFESKKWQQNADKWVKSAEGQKAIAPVVDGSGRPSAFKFALSKGKPWYSAFVKDQNKYKADYNNGLSKILSTLEDLGALPIIDIPTHLVRNYPVWTRLCLKTALENYASYIASDDSTRSEYDQACCEYDEINKSIKEKYKSELEKTKDYLKDNYQVDGRSMYLTSRMCRSFDDIYFEWKKCSSYEERMNVLLRDQSDKTKQKYLGDINFFSWVAKDENLAISDKDCIKTLLSYYDKLREKENKRCCASYTVADPYKSKRYLFFENEAGTNYKKYRMSIEGKKVLIKVPLLLKESEGYLEKGVEFALAPSKQFKNVKLKDKTSVTFTNEKQIFNSKTKNIETEAFEAELGGADLRVDTNASGKITNIFMSFTFDVKEKCTLEFKRDSNDLKFCFSRAYDGKPYKKQESLNGGTYRALSIDLGLKQFGAAAVGQIKYNNCGERLPEMGLERMFLLSLAGEKSSATVNQYRLEATKEIMSLRKEVNFLSFLKRLYNICNKEQMNQLIQRSINYYADPVKKDCLGYCLQNEYEEARKCLSSEYDRIITEMNIKMRDFRSGDRTAKQYRMYAPGKSFWSLEYLEELRRLIMSWNSLSYKICEDNKTANAEYGTVATQLLTHINNIKDDRIKTGADLIIQAARGYVYDEKMGFWIQKYDPCNVIVFEDLSRYRFKNDRAKRENSKLMQWSHREIINEVERQAAVYGISVYSDTDAAYTSKFHYLNKAPGIRCDRLTKNDFNTDGTLKEYVIERLPDEMKQLSVKMKPGTLIPSEIGSVFLTLDKKHKPIMLNADMNAAANLQNRFWQMHTHLLIMRTVNDKGYLRLESDIEKTEVGKRQSGKLLFHFGKMKPMLVASDTKGRFRIIEKTKDSEAPYVGEDVIYSLSHDPSGIFYPEEEWMGYKEFWNGIRSELLTELIKMI